MSSFGNYLEALDYEVTRDEARREIEKRGGVWTDFLRDCGDHPEYTGKTVLDWLDCY